MVHTDNGYTKIAAQFEMIRVNYFFVNRIFRLLLKRFSGNEDPISGRFSGVAKNSRWVENGEIVFGVQEVMVSGDLFGLLRDVIAASTERMVASGGWSAPYLLVDGCSVVFD